MNNLEVAIGVYSRDLDFAVVSRQNLHLVSKEADELIRHDILDPDFADVKSCPIRFPHLMMHDRCLIVVSWHYWNLTLTCDQVSGFIKQTLLYHHSALVGASRCFHFDKALDSLTLRPLMLDYQSLL